MLVATVTSNGTAASGVTVTFTPVAGISRSELHPLRHHCYHRLRWHRIDHMHGKLDARRLLSNGRGDGSHSNGQFHRKQHSSRVFVFYVNGLENSAAYGPGPVYYAVAGAVGFDLSGNVLGGEQDYNDASGFTSPANPRPPT